MTPLTGWSSGFLSADGIKLHYLRRGQGQPALLLHGVSDNGACWGRAAHALAEAYDVILLDQRAHGLSDAPASGYTLAAMTQDVVTVIESLELSNLLLIGHSMGSSVALKLAGICPDLVDKLVMIDTPLSSAVRDPNLSDKARAELRRSYFVWLRDMKAQTAEALLAAHSLHLRGWSPEEKRHWAEAKEQTRPVIWGERGIDFSEDWRAQFESLKSPALFVRGDPATGGRVSDAEAAELTLYIGAENVVMLPATGHSPHREDFEGFIEVLQTFLGA